MFRNRVQLNACCRTLLERSGTAELWSESGPSPAAAHQLERSEGLNPDQRVVLRTCLALWSGKSVLKLADALEQLRGEQAAAVSTLVDAAAHGPEAVDIWLDFFACAPPRPAEAENQPHAR